MLTGTHNRNGLIQGSTDRIGLLSPGRPTFQSLWYRGYTSCKVTLAAWKDSLCWEDAFHIILSICSSLQHFVLSSLGLPSGSRQSFCPQKPTYEPGNNGPGRLLIETCKKLESAPARVTCGILTFLAISAWTQAFNAELPKVSYIKARVSTRRISPTKFHKNTHGYGT